MYRELNLPVFTKVTYLKVDPKLNYVFWSRNLNAQNECSDMSYIIQKKKIIVTLGLPRTKIHAKKVKRLDKLPALHHAT